MPSTLVIPPPPMPSGVPPPPPFIIVGDPYADNGPRTAVVVWILFGLAGIFLSLRLYCKVSRHRGLWWDDHILVASYIALLIDLSLITKMISLGYGKHAPFIPIENTKPIIIIGAVSGVFAICGVAWSKTSFAITLLRLSNGWIKWLLWFVIISMNIAIGLTPLLHWTACRPIHKAWDFFAEGTCIDPHILVRYDIFSAAYSGAMDFLLAGLPALLIKDLQMKKREKIGVAIAMSMGVCAGTTAIVKCVYLPALADMDFSFSGVGLLIWGTAEISTTIIAASIPVLRVFLKEVKSSMERYYRDGTNQSQSATRKSRTGNDTHIEAGLESATSRSRSTMFAKADDDSEKSILAHTRGRIVQTNEVAVEYHARSERDPVSYELAQIDALRAKRE